jgi:hypothetical protein
MSEVPEKARLRLFVACAIIGVGTSHGFAAYRESGAN